MTLATAKQMMYRILKNFSSSKSNCFWLLPFSAVDTYGHHEHSYMKECRSVANGICKVRLFSYISAMFMSTLQCYSNSTKFSRAMYMVMYKIMGVVMKSVQANCWIYKINAKARLTQWLVAPKMKSSSLPKPSPKIWPIKYLSRRAIQHVMWWRLQ